MVLKAPGAGFKLVTGEWLVLSSEAGWLSVDFQLVSVAPFPLRGACRRSAAPVKPVADEVGDHIVARGNSVVAR